MENHSWKNNLTIKLLSFFFFFFLLWQALIFKSTTTTQASVKMPLSVPLLPANFHTVISSDGSRQRICRVGLSQHFPCSLDHVQTLPHLAAKHAFTGQQLIKISVSSIPSQETSVWQSKSSIIMCLNPKRRISPLPQLVRSSCNAPVPQRKACSSDQSSVSWEGPQMPETHAWLSKWFFSWDTDVFGIETVPA